LFTNIEGSKCNVAPDSPIVCLCIGIACKVATNFFLHVPDITPREKELIKSIPDEEVMLVLLGKCKVTAPNIEKSKMLARKTARSNTLDTGIKDLK